MSDTTGDKTWTLFEKLLLIYAQSGLLSEEQVHEIYEIASLACGLHALRLAN